MNARLYDYGSGVFTSVDPLFADMQRAGGLNAYGYVYGNPFGFVDPSGGRGAMAGASNEALSAAFASANLSIYQSQFGGNSASIYIPNYGYEVRLGNLSATTYNKLESISSSKYEALVSATTYGNTESMTLYRGDNSGQDHFVAKGVDKRNVDAAYETLSSAGDLLEPMMWHAMDSANSLFISTSPDANVAAHYASENLGSSSIYTLNVPAGRAIKNILNFGAPNGITVSNPWGGDKIYDNEWLVPIYIPREWITNETHYTGPKGGY